MFENMTDKAKFCDPLGFPVSDKKRDSQWYPFRERQDLSSVRVEG